MGNSSSLSLSNKLHVVRVPDVSDLHIQDARYAQYDLDKKTDVFSMMKKDFETHVKDSPETDFLFSVPTSQPAGIDERGKVTPYVQYAEKLCKEARKKNWKCQVDSFGESIRMILD